MRLVAWEDRNGFKRASWLRDTDPDSMAPEGIPAGPPDLSGISWEDIQREFNNEMIEKNVLTWGDVQREQSAITNSLTRILRTKIVSLYREAERKGKDDGR